MSAASKRSCGMSATKLRRPHLSPGSYLTLSSLFAEAHRQHKTRSRSRAVILRADGATAASRSPGTSRASWTSAAPHRARRRDAAPDHLGAAALAASSGARGDSPHGARRAARPDTPGPARRGIRAARRGTRRGGRHGARPGMRSDASRDARPGSTQCRLPARKWSSPCGRSKPSPRP